jgi:hypothetical protein
MTAAMPAMSSTAATAMPGDFREAHVAHGSILFVEGLMRTGSPHFGQVPQLSLLTVLLSMSTVLMRSFGPAQHRTVLIGLHQSHPWYVKSLRTGGKELALLSVSKL